MAKFFSSSQIENITSKTSIVSGTYPKNIRKQINTYIHRNSFVIRDSKVNGLGSRGHQIKNFDIYSKDIIV